MKKSSSEQQSRIRKQFDSFCKTLLKNEMIDYERERNYRLKYEISFSELTQKELRQLEIMDDYIVESEIAKYMNLVRSTIHHHRTSSLIALKKIMEEIRTGKKK